MKLSLQMLLVPTVAAYSGTLAQPQIRDPLPLQKHQGGSHLGHSPKSARRRRVVELAGYETKAVVTDFAAIALDQAEMVELLYLAAKEEAKTEAVNDFVVQQEYKYAVHVYTMGGFSDSMADLILQEALPFDVSKGDKVTGVAAGSEYFDTVTATLTANYKAGYKGTIRVLYPVADDLDNYMLCQVGGRPDPNYNQCFHNNGDLIFEGHDDRPVTYYYNLLENNVNGRTLHTMAANAGRKFKACANCAYFHDFQKFVDYYGHPGFADDIVKAALTGSSTQFEHKSERTNLQFDEAPPTARAAAADAATAYLVVANFMVREMEDSLVKCQSRDCFDDECILGSVSSLDAAAAFYTGALINREDGGNFLYGLAEQECRHFNTCVDPKSRKKRHKSGTAEINLEVTEAFRAMQQDLLEFKCVEARKWKDQVSRHTFVPRLQAILRAAYYMDEETGQNFADREEQLPLQRGRGAVLTAAILPHVAECHAGDSDQLYHHMHTAASLTHFAKVKEVLERNYVCLGVTCEQVGGLFDSKKGDYLPGAQPCVDVVSKAEVTPEQKKRIIGGGTGAGIFIVALIFLCCCCCCRRGNKKNKRNDTDDGSDYSDDSDLSSLGDDEEEHAFT